MVGAEGKSDSAQGQGDGLFEESLSAQCRVGRAVETGLFGAAVASPEAAGHAKLF